MSAPAELIVALDYDHLADALALVARAGDHVRWYKVGKQLFTRHGPTAVAELRARGKQVFLDLKFHDIPNTVGQAISAAAELGVGLVNVHAAGGPAMLAAAQQAAARTPSMRVLAVTVLTSMDAAALQAVGVPDTPLTQVLRLARLTQAAGLAGVVCSAEECAALRAACGPQFLLVVPGIRPAGSAAGDQRRVMTPAGAVAAGADFLVVGRPITQAPDPAAAAAALAAELATAPR